MIRQVWCSYPRREGSVGFPHTRRIRWSSKLVCRARTRIAEAVCVGPACVLVFDAPVQISRFVFCWLY